MRFRNINIPPIPAVLLAIISVQSGAAIAKTLFPSIGAAGTASLRIGISALILMAVYRPKLTKLTKEQWKFVIPYGLCLGAMNLVFYFAIERIPIGLAVTLEFIGPLMVAVLGSKRAVDFLWVLLAAAGIVLIAPWTTNGVDILGAALATLAGAFWAAYIVLGGKISQKMDGNEAVATGMLLAACLVVPFGIFGGGLEGLTPKFLGMGIALALLSSAIPFTLEMKALGRLPARTFSILMSLEPAAAAICAFIFLQEYLSFNEILAVVFVVAASAGSTITSRR
ncbi:MULTISPECIES: EamA family transporter [Flavobacterium]|jgi:inner membrane transporter RhtA|uniref:Inner membrane transporter RhtA n=1 Tax=Flavobacterium lindanitolerans TaxID=428988 RepID=A0A497TZK4_9FLAO|nr:MULTISPECIES: DMT family transporter [Flavobacterium]THD33609.1 MAG: DMT family transporter [Flavobacterium johnsoniae]KQS47892.1 transporter [Flavobacterium sp. Leaf359]MDQ7962162.1 DMT family transporter [Flavobacterium lindanitolerans]OJX53969.1 MAG: transporter [Flavobacterium sp. 38-13]PKW30293.1 inner membrane transporter RhtA [Flavobacterium lindanitolerans]